MAHPRVFISSTFYDLRQVRSDIEAFIVRLGYDPVLHERGAVAYGSKEALEQYCYREIKQVDILVSVIGGRYGSAAQQSQYSISQQELRTAYEHGIQVYIFVESAVLAEYRTYLKNKGNKGFQWAHVDDVRVYEFLEEVHNLPNNNQITSFDTAAEITSMLREQWAGLFQRFLSEEARAQETNLLKDMQSGLQTLKQLITFLTEERRTSSSTVQDILLSNHPAFPAVKAALRTGHPIFFRTLTELGQFCKAYGYSSVERSAWDDDDHQEWVKTLNKDRYLLKVYTNIFDEQEKLRIFTPAEWDDDWIRNEHSKIAPTGFEPGITDDDVPF